MKAKGHWARNSFQLYLRKHAVIIAPYIQAIPTVHKAFFRYAMPPVTLLPWTALDCVLTGYDYSPDRIISHGLLSGGIISHVQY